MSWDGMLPKGTTCKACGVELNRDGGHPAELYLGTYNGLCYPCTSKPAFLVQECEDGSQEWSHPPHCPSWRRDREIRFGYEGCETCGGQGSVRQYRSASWGGSYTFQCPDCRKRKWPAPAKDPFYSILDRSERERIAYAEAMGYEPRELYPEGHPGRWQWTYNGRGLGRGGEKLEALLVKTRSV